MTIPDIAAAIKQASKSHSPTLIAIEGYGGAGKTTIAAKLAKALGNAYVINFDDFLIKEKISDADKSGFDKKRLEEQVLKPARNHQPISYQRLIWQSNTLSEPIKVPDCDYIIVEGVSSYHPSVEAYYDYKIWVDTPMHLAKQRGSKRDRDLGSDNDALWEVWARTDLEYQALHKPEKRADFIVKDNEPAEHQINETLELIKKVLGPDAMGVYLYGSYTLGGLQKHSDLDLLVVSKRTTTKQDKEMLVRHMLAISADDPQQPRRPVELTIVAHSEVNPWRYPPSLDFQYGDWMRKDFEKGIIEPRETNVEADLAIVVTQVLLTGKTLLGPAPDKLLDPVPYKDFMTATASETDDLMAELETDTRNVLLTLARIWHTLATESIAAKQDAAIWVLQKIPAQYRPVIEYARAVCLDQVPENWSGMKELLKPCADYMVSEIEQLSSRIDFDQSGRHIKVFRPAGTAKVES